MAEMGFAVVGHVEWVEFVRVDRLPAGRADRPRKRGFEEPAGGGAVAAAQLAGLVRSAELFTALGDDDHGEASRRRLIELGVGLHVAPRDQPTRRAITMIDPEGERTITTVGERLAPRGRDPLPWERLDGAEGVYFTAGDADALRAARGAKTLAVTPRAGTVLAEAGVEIDVLVYSDRDAGEREAVASLGPEAAARGCDTRAARAASTRPPTARAASGRPSIRRERSSTTTAAAIPSRRHSAGRWPPAKRQRRRWRWRPAPAPRAPPAVGRTSASSPPRTLVGVVLTVGAIVASAAAGIFAELRWHDRAGHFARETLVAVLYVLLPIITFFNLAHPDISLDDGVGLALAYGAIGVAAGSAYLVATRVLSLSRPSVGAVVTCSLVANTGYLGYPLIVALLGSDHLERA